MTVFPTSSDALTNEWLSAALDTPVSGFAVQTQRPLTTGAR